jgi:hypothetical protein
MLAFLALTLAPCVVAGTHASAQQSGQPSQTDQNQASQNQGNAKANQNMSGSVSSNGKNFVNDRDNKNYQGG